VLGINSIADDACLVRQLGEISKSPRGNRESVRINRGPPRNMAILRYTELIMTQSVVPLGPPVPSLFLQIPAHGEEGDPRFVGRTWTSDAFDPLRSTQSQARRKPQSRSRRGTVYTKADVIKNFSDVM
jgi:hypothetical protein